MKAEPTAPVLAETTPPPAGLGLDAGAKREWRRLVPILSRAGVLTELDVDALVAYCCAASEWRQAREQLRRRGRFVTSPNGYQLPSPWVGIATRALTLMRALLADFGMTPAARARVTRAAPPAASINPLQRFLR